VLYRLLLPIMLLRDLPKLLLPMPTKQNRHAASQARPHVSGTRQSTHVSGIYPLHTRTCARACTHLNGLKSALVASLASFRVLFLGFELVLELAAEGRRRPFEGHRLHCAASHNHHPISTPSSQQHHSSITSSPMQATEVALIHARCYMLKRRQSPCAHTRATYG
jgi:hypothetical protein